MKWRPALSHSTTFLMGIFAVFNIITLFFVTLFKKHVIVIALSWLFYDWWSDETF